jgi:hypothetical protein
VDFVIRACQDRRLADAAGRLWQALVQAPVLGQHPVEVHRLESLIAVLAVVAVRLLGTKMLARN